MSIHTVPTRWDVKPEPDTATLRAYDGVSPVVATLMHGRGIGPDAAEVFLSAPPTSLADPLRLAGMAAAVTRLRAAHARAESICVFGDYDADGLTAQALLVTAFRAWGFADVRVYTPHREREGYGLNHDALQALAEDGTDLVVAVDLGITSVDAIAAAQARGLDVIVVDHHHVQAAVPDAVAVINPHLPGNDYPFPDLAGVGVAYALVRALARSGPPFPRPERALIETLLAFVALGTVADVVPLRGENRILVAAGIAALRKTTHPGLKALCERAGITQATLDAGHIGFALGPRLNAPGRLHGTDAVHELLLPTSDRDARMAAVALDEANRDRKGEELRVLNEAIDAVEREWAGDLPNLLMVGGAGWTAGVVGLVAGKLMDRYHRPVLVYERGETESKGSARSIAAFNIIAAMEEHSPRFLRFGGHARAAGFTIANDQLDTLRDALIYAARHLTAEDLTRTLHLDAKIPHDALSLPLHDEIGRLAPFGHENVEPTFLVAGVRPKWTKRVGADGIHLSFVATLDTGATVKCIGFRLGERERELRDGIPTDLAVCLQHEEWQGEEYLSLRVRDFRRGTAP